jgi:DNA-binding GntR family transcriptional regulator
LTSEELAAELRRRIEAGRLPPDERPADALVPGAEIPSVRALSREHGGAIETVHKAVRQLSDGGLIHPRKGKPAIVADHRPLWIISGATYDRSHREDPSGLTVFEQQTRAAGQGARTDHHSAPGHGLPTWAADLCGLSAGSRAAYLWGEGWAIPLDAAGNAQPAAEYVAGIYDCYVPGWVSDQVPQVLEERNDAVRARWVGGIWSVIERGLGVSLVAQRWRISGAMTTPEESERFGLGRSVPVMVEENCHLDADGQVLVTTRMAKLFGTVRWELDLPVEA